MHVILCLCTHFEEEKTFLLHQINAEGFHIHNDIPFSPKRDSSLNFRFWFRVRHEAIFFEFSSVLLDSLTGFGLYVNDHQREVFGMMV